ncbi:sensor histidine kinase [Haloarchaeobius baliensis]|uniref:sensor histidine kinase n=1 Tax=Haloarchaeobius baliensis TaxID=1670458 RepID=UPI003F881BCE
MDEEPRSDGADSNDGGETVPLEDIPLHSTNILTVLDQDGIVRYESPSVERVLGFDQDELVGGSFTEYFHPDDRDHLVEAFETLVSSDDYTVQSVEYRHLQGDGSYRWVESVAASDPTPEGYYVVNTRDISDRKAREQELERTNERLAEFASVVSHDLRSPLNVADLRVDLARETGELEHLDAVDRAHDRMATLIDDLLALTQAGDDVVEPEPVDLDALCHRCWGTVPTADATLEVTADESVEADRSRLRQLLENLIRNSVEHGSEACEKGSDDGGVTVTVGELDDGFYVADDGPGIAKNDRERVFESGFSTDEDGTGLGLAIVREVADAHDWTVAVTESDGGGARVELSGVTDD